MTTPVEISKEPPTSPWLSVSLASPLAIRADSYGAIRTPELFDSALGRFHHEGLFSERIFGPLANYRCGCGKYSGSDKFGVVCEECGVQIRSNSVRGERKAHIDLPVPILHPWFWGHDLAPAELLLGLSHQQLKQLVRRTRFIRLETPTPSLHSTLFSQGIAQMEGDRSLDGFLARSGNNAVQTLLRRLNSLAVLHLLEDIHGVPRHLLFRPESRDFMDPAAIAGIIRQSKYPAQRIELLRSVAKEHVVPVDMVLEVIPVLPVRLRSIGLSADGHVEVDPVTARYQRIVRWSRAIERCLARLESCGNEWPDRETVRRLAWRERRLSVEVAGLFDDLLQRRPAPLLDFPDREVVVPDSALPLFACRLPEDHAARLSSDVSWPPKSARKADDRRRLESEMAKRPLILNLAASGSAAELLALQPRLTADRAIHVHPLLAATFNRSTADLRAGVHAFSWMESESDCDRLSFPTIGLRDPISGKCRLFPAIDAAVGCYYATWLADDRRKLRDNAINGELEPRGKIPTFASLDDVQTAWDNGRLQLHDLVGINLAPDNQLFRHVRDREDLRDGKPRAGTTVGRAVMNSFLPREFPYFDVPFDLIAIRMFVQELLDNYGDRAAERFVERAASFGLHIITRSGLSVSQTDLLPPPGVAKVVDELKREIARMQRLDIRGIIGVHERRSKVYELVSAAQEKAASAQFQAIQADGMNLHPLMAIFMGVGKITSDQVVRPYGIIGNAWAPWARQVPSPILSNINQGVGPFEYFQLAALSRQQQARALHTLAAPRRLQHRIACALGDVVVTEIDCGSREGIQFNRRSDPHDDKTRLAFAGKIAGRVILHPLYHIGRQGVIVAANTMVTPWAAQTIERYGITHAKVRSPLYCRARRGVCQHCYGADPATGQLVEVGTAVGIKAALAIGPALRALHDLRRPPPVDSMQRGFMEPERGFAAAQYEGVVSLRRLRLAVDRDGRRVVVSPGGVIEIIADGTVVDAEWVAHGAVIHVSAGDQVRPETALASWDVRRQSVLAQDSGTVRLPRCAPKRGHRFLTIHDSSGAAVDGCFLPADVDMHVRDSDRVEIGTLLGAYDRQDRPEPASSANHFQLLERLLTLEPPADRALLAELDGRVELCIHEDRLCCEILVHPATGNAPARYRIPLGPDLTIVARTGQVVVAGDPLTRGKLSLGDLVGVRGVPFVQERLLASIRGLVADLKKERPADERPWELIVAQMLRFVRIEASGDTPLPTGQIMSRTEVMSTNEALANCVKLTDVRAYPVPLESNIISRDAYRSAEEERRMVNPETPPPGVSIPWPAGWSSMLLGIDELARRGSFLTADGLRPGRDALVGAIVEGRQEQLERLQESVVAGCLMPAGSGWPRNDD